MPEQQIVNTPWGPAQRAAEIAPGIVFYTTATHGGIRLDSEHQKKIADILARNFLSSLEWVGGGFRLVRRLHLFLA
jgi:hypothetical protein